jgi:hypothetical protein
MPKGLTTVQRSCPAERGAILMTYLREACVLEGWGVGVLVVVWALVWASKISSGDMECSSLCGCF